MIGRGPVLLATRSAGKLRELAPIFAEAGVETVDLREAGIPPLAEEDELEAFDSFEENALAKAHYFWRRSGLPTVAEDSGLEALALGGAPGVRSKRWSGRSDLEGPALDSANNEELIRRLRGASDRRARYICVAVIAGGARDLVGRGEVRGWLLEEPRGTAGFGYDPFFVPDEADGRTFAELDRAAKQRISHRGRAFAALLEQVRTAGRRD